MTPTPQSQCQGHRAELLPVLALQSRSGDVQVCLRFFTAMCLPSRVISGASSRSSQHLGLGGKCMPPTPHF